MLKIRKGAFETNSSSTHAIIVADNPEFETYDLAFGIGEYGWGWDVLDTPEERASYLYTAMCDMSGRDRANEIIDVLKSYGIHCAINPKPKFWTASNGETYLDNGYVDHCCEAEEFVSAMLSDEKLLLRYIFNNKSFVVVSNDNEDEDGLERFIEKTTVQYPHTSFYKSN